MEKESDKCLDSATSSTPLPEDKAAAIAPAELARRLNRLLNAIPWVSLGAIGTGLGIALLHFYFQSIDFVPADIAAILSASLFVALLAGALCLGVWVCLIFPLWTYRETGLHEPAEAWRVSGLWALQLLGAGAFLLFVGYRLWRYCMHEAALYGVVPGAALTLLGVVGWIFYERRRMPHTQSMILRCLSAAAVCFASMLPFFALWSFLMPNQGSNWFHIAVFFGVWLVAVAGSSTFLRTVPLWGCAIIVVACMPMLMISIPIFQGQASLLPTRVAELAGIRTKKVGELRVPRDTCLLVQSAVGPAKTSKPVSCEGGEWGTVHAQVLSNVGDRWLIELKLEGDMPQQKHSALRLTIPGEGVQTVLPVVVPKQAPESCPA